MVALGRGPGGSTAAPTGSNNTNSDGKAPGRHQEPISGLFDQIGQQGDISGPLDGFAESALVRCAHPGDTAGDHLAAFGDEAQQKLGILVVNFDGFVGAKHANFASSEKRAPEAHGSGGLGFVSFAMVKGAGFVF